MSVNKEAGKGDNPRPYKVKKFDDNFDKIKWNSKFYNPFGKRFTMFADTKYCTCKIYNCTDKKCIGKCGCIPCRIKYERSKGKNEKR